MNFGPFQHLNHLLPMRSLEGIRTFLCISVHLFSICDCAQVAARCHKRNTRNPTPPFACLFVSEQMKCRQFQVRTPSAFLLNTWYSSKERSPQGVYVLVLIWMLSGPQWSWNAPSPVHFFIFRTASEPKNPRENSRWHIPTQWCQGAPASTDTLCQVNTEAQQKSQTWFTRKDGRLWNLENGEKTQLWTTIFFEPH